MVFQVLFMERVHEIKMETGGEISVWDSFVVQ